MSGQNLCVSSGNCGVSTIDTAHNRPNESQQNAKLSRTLFIVIASSLLFWISGIALTQFIFTNKKRTTWWFPYQEKILCLL